MDVVLIFNGLGNQMSQYALYLAKRNRCLSCRCLYFPEQYTNQHNGYELEHIFGIKIQHSPKSLLGYIYIILQYSLVCNSLRRRIVRRLLHFFNVKYIVESTYAFNSSYLNCQKSIITYFYGGWHNPKYFSSVESEIRNTFHFDITSLDSRNKLLLEDINNCNSISIHVRRGDFLMQSNLFGNISNKEYYIRAIAYIKKYVESPVFYVFSDDIVWCRENFFEPEINFIDWNTGTDSWKDMLLISSCKHNINANSTFSWWGAWLNQNPKKIVIVPDKFMNSFDSEKIYPNEWIKISTK